MHWVLTVSKTFSLSKVLKASAHLLCSPFRASGAYETLHRVERLSRGRTVDLAISQTAMGLVLQTETRLNGQYAEELSRKTWRMLHIGENLEPFVEMARHTPELAVAARDGVQQLRGTTLFEDVIKALVLSHKQAAHYQHIVSWIVDQFGDPLPSNPTLHAFPTPLQLMDKPTLQEKVLGPTLRQHIARVVKVFQTQDEEITALVEAHPPLELIEMKFKERLGLTAKTISLVMLYLGRYDYIPVDVCAQRRVSHYMHHHDTAGPEDVRALFEPWQPWGGLAYWLWDWASPASDNDLFNNEVKYGELESQHQPH